jgi:hypothetical protein
VIAFYGSRSELDRTKNTAWTYGMLRRPITMIGKLGIGCRVVLNTRRLGCTKLQLVASSYTELRVVSWGKGLRNTPTRLCWG